MGIIEAACEEKQRNNSRPLRFSFPQARSPCLDVEAVEEKSEDLPLSPVISGRSSEDFNLLTAVGIARPIGGRCTNACLTLFFWS